MFAIIAKTSMALIAAGGLALIEWSDAEGYGDAAARVTAEEARAHAAAVFNRADRNADGALSADEYATHAVVAAELSRLNGFAPLEGADKPERLEIGYVAPAALSRAERTRIDAVARAEFYVFANGDERLDAREHEGAVWARFQEADRDGDGVLENAETRGFALASSFMPAEKPAAVALRWRS